MAQKAAKRRGGQRWEQVRTACFRRDSKADAPCWICGRPIDYAAEPGTAYAWEPDHYLPVSRHPELEFDMDNIRPSHCSCNRSRGDAAGAGKAALGLPSRRW